MGVGLDKIGWPVPIVGVSVTISLLGTLAAIVFIGLIAAEIVGMPAAAWTAALLFGTSLNIATQWNGELYGMALGFVSAGLYAALRRRHLLAAVLWALSVLSHSEFAFAAPAFVVAVSIAPPRDRDTRDQLRRAAVLLALAGGCFIVLLVAGSFAAGKWTDASSLAAWLRRSYAARQPDMVSRPEVARALKGLLTAYTVAGHYWRDILTGRGAATPAFLLASAVGLLVIVTTGMLLAASIWQRRLALFAVAWLLPFHVMFNWWFEPTVEKYHAGALPGLVLLVTGGLIAIGTRLSARRRHLVSGAYVVACAALNIFGALLPMRAVGRDTIAAERGIRRLEDQRGGRAVFIACDNPLALVETGVPFLRVRSVWTGTVPEIRRALTTWTSDRLREGKEPYLVGRWCRPEEWNTTSSKEPFDLFVLDRSFTLVPTSITRIPIAWTVPTNPFNWTRGDIVRLESR